MDVPTVLRTARRDAGLSQARLATLARTSQATISAYESGRKTPSLPTLTRLLAAMGRQLDVSTARPAPSAEEGVGRRLIEVLEVAEMLPTRHVAALRFPRLRTRVG